MKKSFIVLTALVAMTLVGCTETPYINAPGDNEMTKNDTLPVIALPDPVDMEGFEIPDGCLSVYQAIDTCKALGAGGTTKEKYYVKGWVRSFDSKHESGMESFGNGTFYIAATNDGRSDSKMFEAYQVYGKNGKKFTSLDQIAIGDFVIIYGQLTNYDNKAYETVGKGAAYVYASSNPNFDQQEDPTKITPDPEGANVPEGTLNVYEAIHISDSIGSGKSTTTEYYVKGWICKLHSQNESGITGSYHNATFYIAPTNDGTTSSTTFEAYRVKGPNKSNITDVNQVQVGDFVVLHCKIKNYNGTAENDNGGYIYYSSNPNLQ